MLLTYHNNQNNRQFIENNNNTNNIQYNYNYNTYSDNNMSENRSVPSRINSNNPESNLTQNNGNFIDLLRNATHDSNEDITRLEANEENSGYENENYNLSNEFDIKSRESKYYELSSNNISYFEDAIDLKQNKKNNRASTAPTKTLNEAEEFKYSVQFTHLEKIIIYCNKLILRPDNKFDVDSDDGADICIKFLEELEKLIKVLIIFIF